MVTAVRLINYKKHRDFKINPNGRSFFLVGDTEEGKSTVIEAIESLLMLRKFDPEPLSHDAEAGSAEADFDLGDGHTYTFKRRFNRKSGLLRFEVIDENGGEHKAKPLLEKLFGLAFINGRFDYNKYFFECKSSEARTEYFAKAIGGDDVLLNTRKIKARVEERQAMSKDMSFYEQLVENSILDPDNLEEQMELYREPKTLEAIEQYEPLQVLRSKLVDRDLLQADYDLVKEENEKHDKLVAENKAIDEELVALLDRIKLLKSTRKDNEKKIKAMPPDYELQAALEKELNEVEDANAQLVPLIDAAKNEAMQQLNEFNKNQLAFTTSINYYEKFVELSERYEAIENSIEQIREENKKIFMERIPLETLSYDEETGRIMYLCDDGVKRELCFPNISKGRSISVTAQIQRILNPKGNNLIIIPEGQSLGSGLDEITEECNNFGVQYIVEVTERKQKISVMFEEEYLKK